MPMLVTFEVYLHVRPTVYAGDENCNATFWKGTGGRLIVQPWLVSPNGSAWRDATPDGRAHVVCGEVVL